MKKWAVVLVVAICFTFGLSCYKLFLTATHPIKFKSEIVHFSNTYNLEPSLVASLINVESSFNKNAKSNKDAIGLMQIKLDTANYLNDLNNREHTTESQLFEVEINLKYGCEYLRYLLDKFIDTYTALAAYNAGETRVRSWLKSANYSLDGNTLINIPYNETANYLVKIQNNLKFYKKIFNN